MRLWTWRPGWDPLSELQRQVGRLFDLTADAGRNLFESWKQYPALNLYETNDDFVFLMPLPGAKAGDIDITVVGNSLTLKGERKREDGGEESFRRQERWHGKWTRTIQVPDKADVNKVEANLENGVLIVKVAKSPEVQPRQVHVKGS